MLGTSSRTHCLTVYDVQSGERPTSRAELRRPSYQMASVSAVRSLGGVGETAARSYAAGRSFRHEAMAGIALAGIFLHLMLRYLAGTSVRIYDLPLQAALLVCGLPLIYELAVRVWHREFGSDLLAGLSIGTSIVLGQYLAGTVIALMLAGGNSLEAFASRRASAVLEALAKPNRHRGSPATRWRNRRCRRSMRSVWETFW